MLKVDPKEVSMGKFHNFMLGAIGPRPIAFASTVDKDGNPNLSPFSFFNVFSANPPIAIFSPAKSGRTNTHKHTYLNIKETMEVVINIVTYSMVQQASLSSTTYPQGVDEFIKAGFTKEKSELVMPFRVKESPVQFECIVKEIVELGDEGGSGNLIIAEIKLMHINEEVLDAEGKIDQTKIDLVGRMGEDYYCRATGDALFRVPKPIHTLGIGIDQLPDEIRNSTIFTGNDLGMLANVESLPDKLKKPNNKTELENLHKKAQVQLSNGEIGKAWKVLSE